MHGGALARAISAVTHPAGCADNQRMSLTTSCHTKAIAACFGTGPTGNPFAQAAIQAASKRLTDEIKHIELMEEDSRDLKAYAIAHQAFEADMRLMEELHQAGVV